MVQRKNLRMRGKLRLSGFFQELKKGDAVSIVRNPSIKSNFPIRLQGKTGVIENSLGKACLVLVKDNRQEKRFLIEPIHLKKIKGLRERT